VVLCCARIVWLGYIYICVCVCDFLVIWGGFFAVMLVIG
jgi:hypothetical protein